MGSSHSFISPAVVENLELTSESTGPLLATLADGSSVRSQAICRQVQWVIPQYEFTFDLRIMKLGGWDIILGVDWMYQFSPISFDFKQLKITLSNDKETILLEGLVENPVVKKMSGKTVKKCREEE